MTERRSAPRRPSAWPVVALSLAAFFVVVTLLSLQLRAGQDPGLRAAPGAPPAKRRVLIRRIERKTVIEHVAPTEDVVAGEASTVAGPVVSSSTPASPQPSIPAATPAPVTRSS